MKNQRIGILVFTAILVCSAGQRQARAAGSVDQPELLPIDELRGRIEESYRSKKAAKLKKAYNDFQVRKFSLAKKLLTPLLNDPEFGDHARWIQAQIYLEQATGLIEKKSFSEARKSSRNVISILAPIALKYPYSPFLKLLPRMSAEANALSGRSHCATHQWNSCIADYEKALQRWISSNEMAFARPEDLSAYAQACSKKSTETCRAWILRLAQYYSRLTEEFKAIAQFFPEYAKSVPRPAASGRLTQSYRTPDGDLTSIDQAMSLYLQEKYSDAVDAFLKFNDEYPRSAYRFRAQYWLAQALKKSGKDEEAQKLLLSLNQASPWTYYGLLAGMEIQSELGSTLSKEVPLASETDPFLHADEIVRLRRARHFLAEGAYDLAAWELRDFRYRSALSNPFLTYLAMLQAEARNYSTAFPILSELIARGAQGSLSVFFADVIFPMNRFPLVKKASEDTKLDPLLVMSLMKQESSFDTLALSPSGALGLMQLMPVTAVDTISGQARRDLLTPEKNVLTGTTYLSKLMTRFQGNMVYSIAGYNAGPGAVNRWIRSAPNGRGMLEFVESIPYKETRDYVCAVLRNYFWYARRTNTETAKKLTLDFFWHNYGPQISWEASPVSEQGAVREEGKEEDSATAPASSPSAP